ncbi:MAG: hypothetical protein LBR66_01275 [Candidatus Symbiothrix sp.]|jgi:hypothetical protein|nr:hypothetical protein [Candidatus Symbiothrix sp.]
MARKTSFAHQKAILEQFVSLISNFESEFNGLIQKYETDVQALYTDEGLMDEIYDDYINLYLAPHKAALNDIIASFGDEDIPYIKKELDYLSSH